MLWKVTTELLRKKLEVAMLKYKSTGPQKCFLDLADGGEEQLITSLETGGHLGRVHRNTLFMEK